ncbi:MAG: ATP-binding cassette domain-containing protein [Acidimicrobiales bacterium]
MSCITGLWVDKSASFREGYNYLFPGENIVDQWYDDRGTDGGPRPDTAPEVAATTGLLRNSLEIRNLCFAYPDDPDNLVLNNVNLRVNRGEKIGIVGRSGEGKSTLLKILLGFYEPTSGEILVDGAVANAELLGQIQSYVPQDTSLFQETIGYNISYAGATLVPDPDDIAGAARKANISEFIDSLPAGYDTLVGESGIKLSLGQRQRIAIARAFLKPADVLILDEATSALDSETESLVQGTLEHLWADKSAIIIAHRLATLNNVDRIVVIEGGCVVEEGTKDSLLARDGAFAVAVGTPTGGHGLAVLLRHVSGAVDQR